MKRLFGFCVLLFAFVLVSCNLNGNVHEKATVNFSIPVAEILALRNDRNGTSADSDTVRFLVQLKGENSYQVQLHDVSNDELIDNINEQYKEFIENFVNDLDEVYKKYGLTFDKEAMIQYLYSSMGEEGEEFDNSEILSQIFSTDEIIQFGMTNPDLYSEFLEDINVVLHKYNTYDFEGIADPDETDQGVTVITFSFEDVEPGDYTVMLDVLEPRKGSSEDFEIWDLYMTGENTVYAEEGQKNTVEILLEYPSPDGENATVFFDMEVSYEEDNKTVTKTITKKDFEGYMDYSKQKWINPKYEFAVNINNHKPYIREYAELSADGTGKTEETDPWKIIKSFDYVLRDDTHFSENFKITVKNVEAQIVNGKHISIIDLIDSDMDTNMLMINLSQKMDDGTVAAVDIEQWLPEFEYIEISEGEEQEGDGKETGITEEKHGSLLQDQEEGSGSEGSEISQIIFDERDNSGRYIYSVSLAQALGGKKLSKGDTVVFVMKLAASQNNPVVFDRFYYKLEIEDWDSLNDKELYNRNECLNVDKSKVPDEGYYTFVMPLNFIDNPSSYNTVLFFFDGQQSGVTSSGSEMILNVISLDYYIFPAKSKTFVFGVGQNYDGQTKDMYPYRYEFNTSLVSADSIMYELNKGDTVVVTIAGTPKGYKIVDNDLDEQNFTATYKFDGEVYDGANYTSSENLNWQSFHPLSNTKNPGDGNVVSLWIKDGLYSNDNQNYTESGTYCFTNILEPFFDKADPEESPDHDYKFQCVSTCTDPSVLFAIKDFDITMSVVE